jgi:hypothetical protein
LDIHPLQINLPSVTGILRFAGIVNAAVWLGAGVFLIIGLPAIFSDKLKEKLGAMGPPGVGWAAELIIARYFILQYVCCGAGILHLVLEWLYCGKPLFQRNLALLLALAGFSLAGGLWLQPKLKDLHTFKYFDRSPSVQAQAARAFNAWHGASECGNVLVIGGVLYYLWRVSRPGEQARFGSLNLGKIRG